MTFKRCTLSVLDGSNNFFFKRHMTINKELLKDHEFEKLARIMIFLTCNYSIFLKLNLFQYTNHCDTWKPSWIQLNWNIIECSRTKNIAELAWKELRKEKRTITLKPTKRNYFITTVKIHYSLSNIRLSYRFQIFFNILITSFYPIFLKYTLKTRRDIVIY